MQPLDFTILNLDDNINDLLYSERERKAPNYL